MRRAATGSAVPGGAPGSFVLGRLEAGDASADAGTQPVLRYRDEYLVRAVSAPEPGLTLASDAFDAYLELVLLEDPSDVRAANDNGSAAGTDAELKHTSVARLETNLLVRV